MAMKSQNKGMAAAGSEAFSHAGLSPAVSEGVYWCDKPMTKATWALFQLTVSHPNLSPREAGQELKQGGPGGRTCMLSMAFSTCFLTPGLPGQG